MVTGEEERDNHGELNVLEMVIRVYDRLPGSRELVNSDFLAQHMILLLKKAARKSIGDH